MSLTGSCTQDPSNQLFAIHMINDVTILRQTTWGGCLFFKMAMYTT